jgi:hypothetical protein
MEEKDERRAVFSMYDSSDRREEKDDATGETVA